jgi:hypothetical protein
MVNNDRQGLAIPLAYSLCANILEPQDVMSVWDYLTFLL